MRLHEPHHGTGGNARSGTHHSGAPARLLSRRTAVVDGDEVTGASVQLLRRMSRGRPVPIIGENVLVSASDLPLSGGRALEDPVRAEMEARLGHDFSAVRVHTDEAAHRTAVALDAHAYTIGSQIAFQRGRYDHTSAEGRGLLAHELAHVLQQGRGPEGGDGRPGRIHVSDPGDRSEREATAVAAHAMAPPAGTSDLPGHSAHRSTAPFPSGPGLVLRRSPMDAVSSLAETAREALRDLTDARPHEAYLDAVEDLAWFLTTAHEVQNWQSPDTGLGAFDASYTPSDGVFAITVRCRFAFHDGSAAAFPRAGADKLTWTDPEREDYRNRWLARTSSTWSGKHTFHCQRDWWEKLSAKVVVRFVAVDRDPHFDVGVTKIPRGAHRTSSVTAPSVTQGRFVPGTGTFDTEDLKPTYKGAGGGRKMTSATHEAGHMLGLDDEYRASPGAVAHAGLARREFGRAARKVDDARIMSLGSRVDPLHGVTFLAALQVATGVDWGPARRPPKAVPPGAPAHPLGNPTATGTGPTGGRSRRR